MYKENYNITLNQAKQMKEYSFINNSVFSLEELKEIIMKNNGQQIDMQGVLVLTFGNIDIELNILSVDNKYYDLGYYFCARYKIDSPNRKISNGWQSEDYTEREFLIGDLDNIEKIMFNEMIKYAKEKDFYWSKENE